MLYRGGEGEAGASAAAAGGGAGAVAGAGAGGPRGAYAGPASLPRGAHHPPPLKQVAVVGPHLHHLAGTCAAAGRQARPAAALTRPCSVAGAGGRVALTTVPALSPQGPLPMVSCPLAAYSPSVVCRRRPRLDAIRLCSVHAVRDSRRI